MSQSQLQTTKQKSIEAVSQQRSKEANFSPQKATISLTTHKEADFTQVKHKPSETQAASDTRK